MKLPILPPLHHAVLQELPMLVGIAVRRDRRSQQYLQSPRIPFEAFVGAVHVEAVVMEVMVGDVVVKAWKAEDTVLA